MPSTSTITRARQVCAAVIAATVFLLAVLAGRFLFLGDLIIETHGYIGNAVFLVALVNVALGLAGKAGGGEMAIVSVHPSER